MALTFVQVTAAVGGTSAPSIGVAYGSNTTANSYLLGYVLVVSSSTPPTATVADTANGSWTKIGQTTFAHSNAYIFQFPSGAGGADTVTATFSGATPTLSELVIVEYTGQNATPFDVASAAIDFTGTSYTGGSVTPNYTNETVVAIGYYDGKSTTKFTPGIGWTARLNGTTGASVLQALGVEDQSVASGALTTATASVGSSQEFTWFTVGLKSATSAAITAGGSNASWLTVNLANSLRGVRH